MILDKTSPLLQIAHAAQFAYIIPYYRRKRNGSNDIIYSGSLHGSRHGAGPCPVIPYYRRKCNGSNDIIYSGSLHGSRHGAGPCPVIPYYRRKCNGSNDIIYSGSLHGNKHGAGHCPVIPYIDKKINGIITKYAYFAGSRADRLRHCPRFRSGRYSVHRAYGASALNNARWGPPGGRAVRRHGCAPRSPA